MKYLSILLLAGCAANPKQVEGNAPINPLCFVWCHSTKAVTVQEGAKIDGAAGAVSISKPITETTTQNTGAKP